MGRDTEQSHAHNRSGWANAFIGFVAGALLCFITLHVPRNGALTFFGVLLSATGATYAGAALVPPRASKRSVPRRHRDKDRDKEQERNGKREGERSNARAKEKEKERNGERQLLESIYGHRDRERERDEGAGAGGDLDSWERHRPAPIATAANIAEERMEFEQRSGEMLMFLFLLFLAVIGLLFSPALIALGYLIHGMWDLQHQPSHSVGVAVASWFPPMCAAFDFVVGIFCYRYFA